MKQRLQGIFIGVLAMTLILGAVTVIARPTIEWRNIRVAFGSYKVVIDGVPFEAKDSSGKVLEPFNYDGWIYAPFEHIAKALGKTTSWDGDTHTLYLGRKGTAQYMFEVVPAYQSDYHYQEYSSIIDGGTKQFSMAGQNYKNGCILQTGGGFALYNLNMHYKRISFKLGHVDGAHNTEVGTLYIYMDGNLQREIALTAGMIPLDVTLDVTNVRQLRFEIKGGDSWATWPRYGLADVIIE